MKLKKHLAGALALMMALSIAVAPVSAATVTFPDIQKHWAKPHIEDMVKAELFVGFTDGTFRPDDLMDTSMVLGVCARIAVSKDLRVTIGADRMAEVKAMFPAPAPGKDGAYYWFYNEFAVCLETGILTHDELAALAKNGGLSRPLEKAEFARYLVRAMGLDSVARVQETFALNFVDADEIVQELQPYVYLLNAYGVVQGTPENEFCPTDPVSRAITATMLSRATAKMKEEQVAIELPRYTTYQWDAGTITDASAGDNGTLRLSLKNALTGDTTVTVPALALVYQDNRQVQRTALKEGAYARVCYDASGAVQTIRVIQADRVLKAEGILTALAEDEAVIGGKSYAMSRFTEVEAGGKTGGREIIDYEAGYTAAAVTTDVLGNVLTLRLTGGTRQVEGLLTAVDVSVPGSTKITLSMYDGSVQRLLVPANVMVTATGGVDAVLAAGYVGRHVTLRVENDNVTSISAIYIDTAGKYIQGVLRATSVKADPITATIGEVSTNLKKDYVVAAPDAVTYSGKPATLGSLVNGSFVTARLEGGQIVSLSAWPGATYTEGELTHIAYGNPTVLEVTRADGAVVPFDIPTASLSGIGFTRNGATADITMLRTGDSVTVTVQYNAVTSVDARPKSANVSGTVESITFNAAGASITLALPDGTTKTYAVPNGVSATQGGVQVKLADIRIGAKLDLVTSGDQVLSIEVTQPTTSNTKLVGSVLQVISRTNITLVVGDGTGNDRAISVRIPSGVAISDTASGDSVNVNADLVGAQLEIWGAYNSKQEFTATIVVKVG